ncbi:MAG TPA: hypothetical protein VMF57_08850, partial [Solirubrobacteraceae bacterium]|nr:hypothetical protein [Solirubrobacteraceae bacterium]
DKRVKAIVALDNLGGPGPEEGSVPSQQGAPSQSSTIGEKGCPADPADRAVVPITKPGLGMSADYGLPPLPNTGLPEPLAKSTWSLAYSQAGVDSGEIIIRGGSHLDFSFIPNQAFGASLRGADMVAWYTTAWFDKYLKHDPNADNMLLTERWQNDPIEASIDPNHDGNAFSFYYYSRLDIHLANGQVWDCEDLRDGCPGMVPESEDGFPGIYSYLAVDTSPDSVSGPGAALQASSSLTPCVASKAVVFRLARFHGKPITRVRVYVGKRLVMTRRGRSLRSVRLSGLPGNGSHKIRVVEYTRSGRARVATRTVRGCAS